MPTEPLDLQALNVSSQLLNVSWNEPQRRNGILTGYKVYYKLLQNDKKENVMQTTWNVTETENRTVLLSDLGKLDCK